MHLSVRFSTEKELKQFQDLLYEKSGQGVSFTGLLEAMVSEVTIVTAVHNIKSNKGSKTAGVDRMKMDKYLQMPKEELFQLIQSNISNYKPKPAKRKYIEKANGKKRPLGIPTVLDRIIQECMRLILEPICEARFYPHSYGFRPYRAQKHAIRDIVNVINASVKSKDQPVWAVEGDIVFFFHAKTAIQRITKLETEMKKEKEWMKESDWFEMFGDALGNYEQVSLDDDIRWQALQRARELYKKYGGKIFAVGRISGRPYYDNQEYDDMYHWSSRVYAPIDRIYVLQQPIDISEFSDFLHKNGYLYFTNFSAVMHRSFSQ